MNPWWLLPALLVLGAAAAHRLWLRRRERQALMELGQARGLRFSPDDVIGVCERYGELELMNRGHSRCASDLLFGVVDSGRLTLFRHACELGFGGGRCDSVWWVAVVETPILHDHFQALPASSPEAARFPVPMARLRLRADHAATLERMCGPDMIALWEATPPDYRWETRGRLVAVAAPESGDEPSSLLATVCQFARLLAGSHAK